jgi:tetratricopeptide (TPR) repeat protein
MEGQYPEQSTMPTADAVATMQGLVDRHPHDVAALTGLGDAYLAAAMSRNGSPPFTTRRYFQQAVAAYSRAVDQGGRPFAAVGLARALTGLREPQRAIELLTPLAQTDDTPGPVLEVLVAAQEAAGRFADAERTAQRLADMGPAAYPRGPALIPSPQRPFFETSRDVTPALSLGADHLQPLRSRLSLEGGAGGDLADFSFIPMFRDEPGLTGTYAACASWAWRRNALLAGHVDAALSDWPTSNTSARPNGFGCDMSTAEPTALRDMAELLIAGEAALQDADRDDAADSWQNLLRWSGDVPAARQFVLRWQDARADRADLPTRRLAEIDFLQQHYDDAAAEFALAARRTRLLRYPDSLGVAQAELGRAASLIAAGRPAEAEPTLRTLSAQGVLGYAYQSSQANTDGANSFALLSYYAAIQLADEERRTGRLRAAVEDYQGALSWFNEPQPGQRPEVLHNNAALAHLALDNTAKASELIAQALAEDPHNPVTLMTAGFIADRGNDVPGATRLNAQALDDDPGLYPAANDLGVQLARQSLWTEARTAFRQAVGARPDYALGWFNLGVLESSQGPGRLLAAQQALGTAYGLDPDLHGRPLELTIDGEVYRTALDLSKPLPAAWTFADLGRPAPAAAIGLLALAGLAIGLAKGASRGATESADKWMEPAAQRIETMRWVSKIRATIWAVAATILTFLLAEMHQTSPVTAIVCYALGLLVLVVVAIYARVVVAARTGVALKQRAWAPGIVVGLTAGALGYPWAPLPVLDSPATTADPADKARVHLAAPLTLAAVALVLFLETAWTHAPLTEAWAVASLIMCASLLVPVGPLDGKHLDKTGVAMSAGVVGAALLYGLGLL